MKLYFSGLAGKWEASVLRDAGVDVVLVDPFDLKHAENFPVIAMDSGAYRASKKDVALPEIPEGNWDFVVAPDVIGDPEASREAWLKDTTKMPVWHWGEPMALLRWYLEQTDGIVGIGGCVHLMRKRSGALWHGLYKICQQHPGRFHVFGANWLAMLDWIAPYVSSADTSKWLDGARYGEIIDHDLKSVKSDSDRRTRCLVYARVMNEVFNLGGKTGGQVEEPEIFYRNFLQASFA